MKGCTTTADYTGEVYRTGVTVIRYTVIYGGTPLVTIEKVPVEEPEPGVSLPVVLLPAVLAALAVDAGGAYLLMKYRKERHST